MRKIIATVLLLASLAGAQTNKTDINAQIKAAPLTDTGSANAYVVSMSMMGTSYYTGMPVVFKAANTNSGTSTINVNAIGAKTIKKTDGATNLASGDLQAGAVYLLVYDGTNFQLLAPSSGTAGSGGTVTNVATSSPITGGPITTTGTIGIQDSAADGSTKGAATFTAADFNSSLGLISLDYTNGQAADASHKGFVTSTDWSTFNSKQAAIAGNSLAAHNFANSINSAGTIAGAQPAVGDLANVAADAVLQNASGSSAAPSANVVTACGDGTHAVSYIGHAWGCQLITGGAAAAVQPVGTKTSGYTVLTTDFDALKYFSFACTSSCDATLPASAPSTNGEFVTIKNNSLFSLFILPNGLTLDGDAAPLLVPAGASAKVWTNASNYFSDIGQLGNFPARRRWSREDSALAALAVVGSSYSTAATTITATVATSTEAFFEDLGTSTSNNATADTLENTGKWGMASSAFNTRFSGRFGIDDGAAGVTSIRAFFGLIDQNATTANYFGATSSDAPTQNAILFRCSSNASDTNWMAMVSRSTGATTASTGVACNTSNHTFAIQEHGAASAYFYVDGVMKVCIGTDTGCTSAASKYPAFASARAIGGITTLTTAVRHAHFFWMQMESDF